MDWAGGPKDDSESFVSYPVEVTSKYIIGRVLGKGAFGKVFHGALVHNPSEHVAIKYIEDVFMSAMDARRALREISIMRQCAHPNIMALKVRSCVTTMRRMLCVARIGVWRVARGAPHSHGRVGARWVEI
jgi:hypothetical protein